MEEKPHKEAVYHEEHECWHIGNLWYMPNGAGLSPWCWYNWIDFKKGAECLNPEAQIRIEVMSDKLKGSVEILNSTDNKSISLEPDMLNEIKAVFRKQSLYYNTLVLGREQVEFIKRTGLGSSRIILKSEKKKSNLEKFAILTNFKNIKKVEDEDFIGFTNE